MPTLLEKKPDEIQIQNRRELFRHSFTGNPLCGTISILAIGQKNFETNKAFICINDISSGGVRFESHLNLPVREDMILQILTTILGYEIKLMGMIRRKKLMSNSFFEYGFEFLVNEHEADHVNRIINELSIKMRKSMNRIAGCNMCSSQTRCHVNLVKIE